MEENLPLKKRFDEHLEHIALIMALHCVRNTVIEKYHVAGKLTNKEMMAFNKEVVNKLYSFLQFLFNPYYEKDKKTLFEYKHGHPLFYEPNGWDKPKFDDDFLEILDMIKSEKVMKKPPEDLMTQ